MLVQTETAAVATVAVGSLDSGNRGRILLELSDFDVWGRVLTTVSSPPCLNGRSGMGQHLCVVEFGWVLSIDPQLDPISTRRMQITRQLYSHLTQRKRHLPG
jgi:hypothetical protein